MPTEEFVWNTRYVSYVKTRGAWQRFRSLRPRMEATRILERLRQACGKDVSGITERERERERETSARGEDSPTRERHTVSIAYIFSSN